MAQEMVAQGIDAVRVGKKGPQLARERSSGWTTAKERLFLETLAVTSNVKASLDKAGMSRAGLYKYRKRSAHFRSAWDNALAEGYDPGEPGAVLAAEQFARLRAELDASFSGTGNAGRPLLLEGGLKWQSLSLTPADMDFVGLKAAAAREIALAFGVPPMLLGLPGDATYATIARRTRRCGG